MQVLFLLLFALEVSPALPLSFSYYFNVITRDVLPRCFTSELILQLCRESCFSQVFLYLEASGSKWCEEERQSVFKFKYNNSAANLSSVCIFHAAIGCFAAQLHPAWVLMSFFPSEIRKHHTGQQMQIIPEPPRLPRWVNAVLAEIPLTTCVFLLCCRHLFSEPSTHMWIRFFFLILSYPAHLFVVNSCVSLLLAAVTQSCREITGMFYI